MILYHNYDIIFIGELIL